MATAPSSEVLQIQGIDHTGSYLHQRIAEDIPDLLTCQSYLHSLLVVQKIFDVLLNLDLIVQLPSFLNHRVQFFLGEP